MAIKGGHNCLEEIRGWAIPPHGQGKMSSLLHKVTILARCEFAALTFPCNLLQSVGATEKVAGEQEEIPWERVMYAVY